MRLASRDVHHTNVYEMTGGSALRSGPGMWKNTLSVTEFFPGRPHQPTSVVVDNGQETLPLAVPDLV
jgi:hypothetical protein